MEIWKDIPHFEGLYEASSYGRIRTKEGKTTQSVRFNKRVWKQRILKQRIKRNKYGRIDYTIALWKEGKPYYFNVSRIIASSFHENLLFSDFTVNHIDGNPQNNNAENLEWISRAENIRYGFKNGQYSSAKQIIVKSKDGNVVNIESYASLDRYLERPIGYTSRAIKIGKSILKAKDGKEYHIIRA